MHYFDPLKASFEGTRATTVRLHVKPYGVTKYTISVAVE